MPCSSISTPRIRNDINSQRLTVFREHFPPFCSFCKRRQAPNMEKTKILSLGVQKKKKNIKPSRRNKMRLLTKVVDYLKSDSYMYAPLINSNPPNVNSSSARGLKMKEPTKGKNERLLKKIVDYLKSDSYMHASLLTPQAINSPSRVHMEISRTTLTMEDNQATVESANVMAEDQFSEGNLLETSISDSHDLSELSLVIGISVTGMLDSKLRNLLVD